MYVPFFTVTVGVEEPQLARPTKAVARTVLRNMMSSCDGGAGVIASSRRLAMLYTMDLKLKHLQLLSALCHATRHLPLRSWILGYMTGQRPSTNVVRTAVEGLRGT
jgi:hypothetical protein